MLSSEDRESSVGARPFAVSEVPIGERTEPINEEPAAAYGRRRRETYPGDFLVAFASAVLIASTFLPWYRGFGLSISGWDSGAWGPVITFLGGLSLLLILLRRIGLSISLPFEESLVHEGIGWVSLAGAVVKSRFRPGGAGLLGISYGIWVAIGAAVILVVLAGRMSPRAPLVLRPGWYKGRAGTIGIVLVMLVAAGAATFGATNSADLTAQGGPSGLPRQISGRLPDCAKGFPIPAGVKPEVAFEAPCQAQLSSDRPVKEVAEQFKSTLGAANWTFTVAQQVEQATVYTLTAPRCATLAMVASPEGTTVAVVFTPCSPTPTPTGS